MYIYPDLPHKFKHFLRVLSTDGSNFLILQRLVKWVKTGFSLWLML
jgi:hypothetical protein